MELRYRDGLVPAIIQEQRSGNVLMLGFMNAAALEETLRSGTVTFYSRSRRKLWKKGEISGHRLFIREVRVDCDRDALLIQADLTGPGCCHEGYVSCFFRRITPAGEEVIAARQFDPAEIYGTAEPEGRR